MKKREFIAAICFICIFGMLVTVQVKRFVSSPSQRADVQEYTASKEYELKRTDQTGPVLKDGAEAAGIREEAGAEQEQDGSNTSPRIEPEYPEGRARGRAASGREAAAAETAPDTPAPAQELQRSSRGAASADLISPASETTAVSETAAEKEEQATAQAYQRELDSAAASIKKLKSAETDTSTWSYLNLADYELKLWDDLLNRIYQDIIEHMDETEAEELRKEEKAWIKKRDADAKKVSSRYSGGTLEGLEHTASLAKSTKERAYELLEDYGSYLPQEEVSGESGEK